MTTSGDGTRWGSQRVRAADRLGQLLEWRLDGRSGPKAQDGRWAALRQSRAAWAKHCEPAACHGRELADGVAALWGSRAASPAGRHAQARRAGPGEQVGGPGPWRFRIGWGCITVSLGLGVPGELPVCARPRHGHHLTFCIFQAVWSWANVGYARGKERALVAPVTVSERDLRTLLRMSRRDDRADLPAEGWAAVVAAG